MKIAYFLDIPHGLGGAGNLLLQQAALMSDIHDVLVVIPTDENDVPNVEYARRCERNGLAYTGLHYQTAYNFSMIDFNGAIASAVFVENLVEQEGIDFFHSVQLNTAVEYVSRKLQIPHLMNIYQLMEEEFAICPGDIYPHYHLCDSLLYSKLWQEKLLIRSKCLRPVAPLDHMQKKGLHTDRAIRFVMLGNVCENKNQLTAVRAFKRCLQQGIRNIELYIVGECSGGYAEKCKAYVHEHMLEDTVFFYGFVSDVGPLLEKCDCLLCTSMSESFPSSMVEALTYDLTILSTPVAGVPELLVDQENSFVSEGYFTEDISRCIQICVKYYENGKIKGIHEKAEKTWEDYFSRDKIRKEMDLYYQMMCANKSFGDLDIFDRLGRLTSEMESLMERADDTGAAWIRKRGLYYAMIRERLSSGKAYIWGAGKWGRITLEILKIICPKLKIEAFVDSFKKGQLDGIPIQTLDGIPYRKDHFYCISFLDGRNRAVQFLKERGLALNQQVWFMPQ